MIYALPPGHRDASKLDFSRAVEPAKNALYAVQCKLMATAPGQPVVIPCFRVKRWGGGISGDHKARWRLGRGLNRGMRSLKLIVAKTAKAGH